MFKRWRAVLLGFIGRYLYYLNGIGVRKVELALYNRTYYFCQMPCLRCNRDYIGIQPAEIL